MTDVLRIEPEWLFDGSGRAAQTGQCVLIRNERIEAVAPVQSMGDGGAARVMRLPGIALLPGLIDAHVHLTFCGCSRPRQTLMAETNEMLLLRAAEASRDALWHGITTVRDCGDRDGVTFHLRQAIDKGIVPGPRMLLAGAPLTPPRGHCYFLHGEVEGQDQIRAAIERLAARGADFIKVMATGGGMTPGTDSLGMQFSSADLRFIVEEARRFKLRVAAHAHSPESIAACVDAGVATVEHASFLGEGSVSVDQQIVERMAARKVAAVPTNVPACIAVRSGRPLGLAARVAMDAQTFVAARQEVVSVLHRGGVRVIAGTDGGATNVRITDLAGEIQMLADAGLGMGAALAAATSQSAAALGLCDLGLIAPGKLADLLGVRGNPTQDPGALRRPLLVIQNGCVIREEQA